jgi:hypothetical protein
VTLREAFSVADYSKRNKELAQVARRLARDELVQEQADVFAFADRNREIVELPPGLENGLTMKRKRGARTDTDCINEICEIVAQGITATIFIDKCEHVSLLREQAQYALGEQALSIAVLTSDQGQIRC